MLIKLKSCPRCNGDLFLDWDQHGRYVECLQCGYVRNLRSHPDVEQQLAEEEKEPALADKLKVTLGTEEEVSKWSIWMS